MKDWKERITPASGEETVVTETEWKGGICLVLLLQAQKVTKW